VSLSAGEKSREEISSEADVEYTVSKDGKDRIERAPELEDMARRLGSWNRLKRVSRWYCSALKGTEGAKTCFASLGEI